MRHCAAAGALFCCAILAGCGGAAQNGKVFGKVTVGDALVTAGEVRFHGPNGSTTTARINSDGTYSIPDVATGETKITVHTDGLTAGGAAPPKGTTPIDMGGSGGSPSQSSKSAKVPIKYQHPDSTDLKLNVKSGDNPFDVQMKS
jgi:hypothetical protein